MAIGLKRLSLRIERIIILASFLFIALGLNVSYAYFNVTQLNTTVLINQNTSAKVIETLFLYVSNASENSYTQDRGSYNLSLNGWQNILHTSELTPHLLGAGGAIRNLTFVPTVLIPAGNGGHAELIMSYYITNMTIQTTVGPRIFQYAFNDSTLNFQHTASGQSILPNQRLTIIIPKGAHLIAAFPLPDSPIPNNVGNFTNDTTFSWFASEPLNQFQFSYTTSESLQDEVSSYFSGIYKDYTALIYLLVVALIIICCGYIYVKYIR